MTDQPGPLEAALADAVEDGAEELHLFDQRPALQRRHGALQAWDVDPRALAREVLHGLDAPARRRYDDGGPVSTIFCSGPRRFRARLHESRGGMSCVLRVLADRPQPAAVLGLPNALLEVRSGLVLIAGPRGSGRTTSAHAWVEHIHASRTEDITIIESPPEVHHGLGQSTIVQRSVGLDAGSMLDALHACASGPTSVVVVDEVDRDPAALRAALDLATTGRLVLATVCADTTASALGTCVHGTDAAQYRHTLRGLADALCAVLVQRRLPSVEGPLVTARAHLEASSAVRAAISAAARDRPSHCLHRSSALEPATGLDESIASLLQAGTITAAVAQQYATRPQRFNS